MNKLPLLAKNAYLKLFYTTSGIYAKLMYSHYDLGRSYSIDDFTMISPEDFENGAFWNNYFSELEKEFDWNLFKEHGGVAELSKFIDEGEGLSGVKLFYSDSRLPGLDQLRNYLPEVDIELFENDKFESIMKSFSRKFGYTDVLWVDANLNEVNIYRLRRNINGEDEKLDFHNISSKKLTNDDLINIIKDPKINAFMTESLNLPVFYNAWVNHILTKQVWSENLQVQDLLRAFLTIQLLSLVSDNREFIKDFGTRELRNESNLMNCAMIVTGELLEVLNEKDLLITLLDGLQLEGIIDIYFDKTKSLQMFAESYFFGINSTDIILSRKDVIPNAMRVILPEVVQNKNNRQVVMSGTMSDPISGGVSVYALSPEISEIHTDLKQKMYYNLKFVRGSYMKTLGESVEFIIDPEKISINKMYIDCRPKPVIYGPDPKSNKNKLSQWLT
jgi:hypothetical protein